MSSRARHPLLHHPHRLQPQHHPQPRRGEARGVRHHDRLLPDPARERQRRVQRRLRGLPAPHHLQQLHDVHGVEEVQPHHPLRPRRGRRDLARRSGWRCCWPASPPAARAAPPPRRSRRFSSIRSGTASITRSASSDRLRQRPPRPGASPARGPAPPRLTFPRATPFSRFARTRASACSSCAAPRVVERAPGSPPPRSPARSRGPSCPRPAPPPAPISMHGSVMVWMDDGSLAREVAPPAARGRRRSPRARRALAKHATCAAASAAKRVLQRARSRVALEGRLSEASGRGAAWRRARAAKRGGSPGEGVAGPRAGRAPIRAASSVSTHPGAEEQLGGPAAADQAGEEVRGAPVGVEADAVEGEADARVGGGDAEVAGGGEGGARARRRRR